jgi:hypothetical protein
MRVKEPVNNFQSPPNQNFDQAFESGTPETKFNDHKPVTKFAWNLFQV